MIESTNIQQVEAATMIIRKMEPYVEYTKLDRNVFADSSISDGAARLYAYLSGLKTGGQFKDSYIMKCLGISQPSLTRRKRELKDKDLILIDKVGPKQYFLYIGNTKVPASQVKAHWEREEDADIMDAIKKLKKIEMVD